MEAGPSVLVFALGLAAVFLLLSIAPLYAGMSPKERQIQELQAARIDTGLFRMVEPESICFTLDNEILDKYPTLAQAIREADEYAQEDIETNNRYGNYYTGTGTGLDESQAFSFIRAYDFNQTISRNPGIDRYFVYQDTRFSCGFNYSGNHYLLSFSFRMLDEVNTENGYVPIRISEDLVDGRKLPVTGAITYVPFNNTAVFFNELSTPVTIEIHSNGTGISETLTLLPDNMQDMNLRPNWASLENMVYHYKVSEYPWIRGEISTSMRYYTGCMSKEEAKSLYAQRDFEVKFPSYLPEGFSTGCITENTNSYIIQAYVNQTATDYHTSRGIMYSRGNPYPFYLYGSMAENEVKGIVQVHGQKYYLDSDNPREQGYSMYLSMLENAANGYATDLQFIDDEVRGVSYIAYNEGMHLSRVIVLTTDESYHVVASLPMDETIEIARSLS